MKLATGIWLGVAGLALFLLLGQLFSAYPDLRAGVSRLFILLAIGAATVGAVNVLLFVAQQDAGEINGATLRTPVIASGLVVAGILGVLLLVMAVGGA
jgi:hypothetical protein